MTNGAVIRILVVRTGGVGDFILTLPVLAALRQRWPRAYVEILGRPHIAELARGRGYADAVTSIDQAVFARLFVAGQILPYFSDFDLVVSFLSDREGIFAQNLRHHGIRSIFVDPPSSLHAAEHFLRALKPLGIPTVDPAPRILLTSEDRDQALKFFERWNLDSSRRLIAVHPGSGSPKKNWPVERFTEVCRWLRESKGADLLLIEGEADREPAAKFAAALKPESFAVAQGLPLVPLAAGLEHCALFLGNDSGISHLAAAVGAKVVVFFGPTSPQIWRPLGDDVRVLTFEPASFTRVKEVIDDFLHDDHYDLDNFPRRSHES